MARIVGLLGCALAWLAAACTTAYDVAQHEVHVRILPGEDAALVLEIERGLSTTPKRQQEALRALQSALAGGKRFPPEGGLLTFDFDEVVLEEESAEERAGREQLSAAIHVQEVRLFRDERHRLCFARSTRIAPLSRVLAAINSVVSFDVNGDRARSNRFKTPFQPEFPVYDLATREAVWKAAESGHAWLSVRDGALVLDVPMTEANAGKCLVKLLEEARDHEDSTILSQVSSLQVADGHALLRFGEAHHPCMTFAFPAQEGPIDEVLVESLRAQGLVLWREDALERMMEELENASASEPTPR